MRNFDPDALLKASVKDILADQRGVLFALDSEVEALCEAEQGFYLRAWEYSHETENAVWTHRIVRIGEAIELAKPIRWADDFKRRWIEAYEGRHYLDGEAPHPIDFLNEAASQAGLSPYKLDKKSATPLMLIRLLISLEAGRVIGANHPQLISLANVFDRNDGYRARALIIKALNRWHPNILSVKSMSNALRRAERVLAQTGDREWGRRSDIGRLREVLFPDWALEIK